MLLSDHDILDAHQAGHLNLDPWTPAMVQPSSVDVRLDRYFRVFNNHQYTYVDPAEDQGALTEQFEVPKDEPWILHPGEFVLGSTWEYVKLDSTLAARLEGKSSLGRLGILTHSTAGFVDPGFEGHITLELSNVSTLPVKLWPGMKTPMVPSTTDPTTRASADRPRPAPTSTSTRPTSRTDCPQPYPPSP